MKFHLHPSTLIFGIITVLVIIYLLHEGAN